MGGEKRLAAGIDIGSATSKAVLLDGDKRVLGQAVIKAGTGTRGPRQAMEQACAEAGIRQGEIGRCVATGYGRTSYCGADRQVTEITCHARGVRYLCPQARTVIDIGGQDAKVIRLDAGGAVERFYMNDKCAAGTGRFLEVMARVLELPLTQLAEVEGEGRAAVISSTCTVFAESEVISQLSAGTPVPEIVRGIHQSVAGRIAGLAGLAGVEPQVVMCGGVARNLGVVGAVSAVLKQPVAVAPHPQITGAIGAALLALEDIGKTI